MVFSFFASKKGQDAELKKVAEQTDAAALMQQQAMMNAGAAKPTSISTDLGVSSDQVTQMQNAIQQKIDNMAERVTSSQDRITNLSDAASKTEQDISSINQHLDQLTTAMQQMLLELETIKECTAHKHKKRTYRLPVAYHIRAIVPGRVWLESSKGKSVSLRVGNKLEGYGVVRVISPRQGMVVMSNGSIIQYGVNDF
jgi:intracellular multiplication protein IcmG